MFIFQAPDFLRRVRRHPRHPAAGNRNLLRRHQLLHLSVAHRPCRRVAHQDDAH